MQNLYPLVWISFIVCLFLMWFFMHRANHRERMLRIEKDINPDQDKKDPDRSMAWKKVSGLIIGLSIGLLIISILVSLKQLERFGNAFPIAILGISGGIGLRLSNQPGKRNE